MATQAIDPLQIKYSIFSYPTNPTNSNPISSNPRYDPTTWTTICHDLHDQTTPGETVETVANHGLGLALRAKGEGEVWERETWETEFERVGEPGRQMREKDNKIIVFVLELCYSVILHVELCYSVILHVELHCSTILNFFAIVALHKSGCRSYFVLIC